MRIILTGGGTGGHLYPLVAVAKKLKELLGEDTEIIFVGPKRKLEIAVMKKAGIPVKHVASGKLRRYFSMKNFSDILKIPVGVIQSLWILLIHMPDAIFSKGGFASFPVVFAAWIYRIPVMIHESDATPGLANRILSKFAQRIAVSYTAAEKKFPEGKTALTGNPIRKEISEGNSEEARNDFKLTESKPVVLVMGGSQGSRIINRAIVKILPKLQHHAQIIQLTGEDNYNETVHMAAQYGSKAGRNGYVVRKYMAIDELKNAYAVCDLVVSRAGANSISEIAANGKASILVPLASAANDHQRMNAYEIARAGGALVLEEQNLGEYMLFDKIEQILFDKDLKSKMGENIMPFYHPDAAEKIAQGIVDIAKRR